MNNEAATTEVIGGPKVNGSLPLYAEPRAVHSVTHRDVAVRVGGGDFGFAAKAPMVQITVDEFERAALDYPIVFFGDDRQPFVVSGLELDRNVFVKDGHYVAGAYIPAYLRRYPFVFARDEGSDALVLCLDHASDRVTVAGEPGAEKLFDGQEPTALTRQALNFCESYEAADARTKAFVTLVGELGLFESKQAHYTAPGAATPTLLLEHFTIDRARLDDLSAEDFSRLRDARVVSSAYAQIASQANWEVLLSRKSAD